MTKLTLVLCYEKFIGTYTLKKTGKNRHWLTKSVCFVAVTKLVHKQLDDKILHKVLKNKFFEKISKFFNKDLEERVSAIEKEVAKIKSKLTSEKIQTMKDPNLIKSPDGRFQIRIKKHSDNMDMIMLFVSAPILTDDEVLYEFNFPKKNNFYTPDETWCSEIAHKLRDIVYETEVCSQIILRPFEITITKTAAVNWDFLIKLIKDIFVLLAEKYPPVPATEEQISKIRNHITNSKDEVQSFTKKLLLYLLEKSKCVTEPVNLTLRESDELLYDFIEKTAMDLQILRSSSANTEINSFISELGLNYDFTCHFGFYDKKGIWNSEKQIGFEKGKDELAYTFLFSPINYRNDGAKRLPFNLAEIEAVSLS